jgi:hypothetical protein
VLPVTGPKERAVSPLLIHLSLQISGNLHGEEKADHGRYTDELVRRAITEGLDAEGKTLHWIMPRWTISERDLDDLIGYLKTLEYKSVREAGETG